MPCRSLEHAGLKIPRWPGPNLTEKFYDRKIRTGIFRSSNLSVTAPLIPPHENSIPCRYSRSIHAASDRAWILPSRDSS